MFRFVKIKNHPNWFLVIDKPISPELNDIFNQIRENNHINNFFKETKPNETEFEIECRISNLTYALNSYIDYNSYLKKYNESLIVRQPGSFMFLSDQIIERELLSEFPAFPIDDSDIVICENDHIPESWWIDVLQKEFPKKTIETLNLFKHRTIDELKVQLTKPTIITFTTTFLNLDWFENLITVIKDMKGKTLFIHWKGDEYIWLNVQEKFKKELNQFKRNNKLEIYKK